MNRGAVPRTGQSEVQLVRSTTRLALAMFVLASPASAAPGGSRTAVGPQYAAGAFHKAMLGRSYRELWATPIEVEELDLAAEAGGLTPVRRVGGQQTKGVALRGRDGRSYTFRSLDKDPSNILPEELQDTFVEELVQDQMAAQHPAAALVTDELARAAGVPTVPIRIVRLPDDPALGELRDDFAGLVGTFSEYPTAGDADHEGYEGATQVIDHLALYARLAASPDDRVDVRQLLRARLFDVLISDFDRHRRQWRWARRPGDDLWHPIPEDRDQAFARYEGLLVRAAARYVPQLRTFGDDYDTILGLTYNGREQDRWLLPELTHEAWVEAAGELQRKVSDEAIERAARRMPPEWYAIDGARLVASLKKRRDALPAESERYYRHLAGEVDIQGTDASEDVRAEWGAGGALEIEVLRRDAGGTTERPYFRRRFVPAETREVRLYLRGGEDRVHVSGTPGSLRLRVIGGTGDDTLDDHEAGWARLYDSEGNDRIRRGPGTTWDRRSYRPPPGPPRSEWIQPRDWGRDWFATPWLGFGPDSGLFVGAAATRVGYGFRRQPFADRHTWRVGWAFGARQPRIEYDGLFHRVGSRSELGLLARYSGLEVVRYYGYGNDADADESAGFYKVRHQQLLLTPSLSVRLPGDLELTLTPLLQHTTTGEGTRLIDLERPYGVGSFGQVGGWARLRLDARRGLGAGTATRVGLAGAFGAVGYPTSGVLVEAVAAAFPAAWDVERPYGWVESSASGYLTAGAGGRATLALRAGGRQMAGGGDGPAGTRYPFFNAAALGGGGLFSGSDTLRGFPSTRFIGDRSLYGNAELRLYLSRFFVALPGEWGLLGFADAGRVWLRGESSDTWHSSWGAGLWIGLLSRSNAVALTFARSDERTAAYVRAGFSF